MDPRFGKVTRFDAGCHVADTRKMPGSMVNVQRADFKPAPALRRALLQAASYSST